MSQVPSSLAEMKDVGEGGMLSSSLDRLGLIGPQEGGTDRRGARREAGLQVETRGL